MAVHRSGHREPGLSSMPRAVCATADIDQFRAGTNMPRHYKGIRTMTEQKKSKPDEKHATPMKDKNAEMKPDQDVKVERDRKSEAGKSAAPAKP